MTDGEDATIISKEEFKAFKEALSRPGDAVPGLTQSMRKASQVFQSDDQDKKTTSI